MCSTCQPTTRKEQRNKLENRTTILPKLEVSVSPGVMRKNGASTQPRRVQLPKMSSSNLGAEAFGFTRQWVHKKTRQKTQPTFQLQMKSHAQRRDWKNNRPQSCATQEHKSAPRNSSLGPDCGGDMDKRNRMFDISTLSNLARRNPFLGAT